MTTPENGQELPQDGYIPERLPDFLDEISAEFTRILEGASFGSPQLLAVSDVLETKRIHNDVNMQQSVYGFADRPPTHHALTLAAQHALVNETVRNRLLGADGAIYRETRNVTIELFNTSHETMTQQGYSDNWTVNNTLIDLVDEAVSRHLDSLEQ